MAAIVMWNQKAKRAVQKDSQHTLSWLKAVGSLVVVMGFTWITGLLIIEEEKLAPLAFMYIIAVAFQGFFIFLILVVFTKAVRNDVKEVILAKSEKMRNYFTTIRTDSSVMVSKGVTEGNFEHKFSMKESNLISYLLGTCKKIFGKITFCSLS